MDMASWCSVSVLGHLAQWPTVVDRGPQPKGRATQTFEGQTLGPRTRSEPLVRSALPRVVACAAAKISPNQPWGFWFARIPLTPSGFCFEEMCAVTQGIMWRKKAFSLNGERWHVVLCGRTRFASEKISQKFSQSVNLCRTHSLNSPRVPPLDTRSFLCYRVPKEVIFESRTSALYRHPRHHVR